MSHQPKEFVTGPCLGLRGEIQVGPDKSISHRSLIFAALATGQSSIKNLLLGDDVLNTLQILNQLGVSTSHTFEQIKKNDELIVEGVGLFGFKTPEDVLYCGNSGTTMRLMMGVLAAQKFESVMTGDQSLNKRPMERVMKPLQKMGAHFQVTHQNHKRYIHVLPTDGLHGMVYESPVASAQIKSSLMLAGLHATGNTEIIEPAPSRNHSEIMLKSMGANIKITGNKVRLIPVKTLSPFNLLVPGDISSAAFFMVAALIVPHSDLVIRNVNLNPTRTGILDALTAMGGDITIIDHWEEAGEVVGHVRFKSSALKNVSIGGDLIPRLIDEIPILALAASVATGTMVLSDAQELRVKESDRIKAVCGELLKMGVDIQETEDGFVIHGGKELVTPSEPFQSFDDHRMAMMEVIAGLMLREPAVIDDVTAVSTSFPEFFDILENVRG